MDKPSIISNENLIDGTPVKVERIFQDFDPNQLEELKILRENEKHIYSPEFVPFYISIVKEYELTSAEGLIYGFIRFYCANGTGRFYFTNLQMAEILNISEATVERGISVLRKKELIHTGYRIKGGGGTIRFINGVLLPISSVPTDKNVGVTLPQNVGVTLPQNVGANNNKINNNKIKGTPNKITKSSKEDITSDAFKEYLKQTVPFSDIYITSKDLVDLAEKIDSWSKSKGRTVKDWKATARNWLIKDIAKYPKWKPGDIRNTFPNLQKI